MAFIYSKHPKCVLTVSYIRNITDNYEARDDRSQIVIMMKMMKFFDEDGENFVHLPEGV